MAEQAVDVVGATLTREIFGNIPHWSKVAFYAVAAAATVAFVWGVARRVAVWRRGQRDPEPIRLVDAASRLIRDVLLQSRNRSRGLASLAHGLLFGGFALLLLGTTLIAIEHLLAAMLGRAATDPVFHKGVYFAVFEVVMDAAGVALLAGCAMFLQRRWKDVGSFGRSQPDIWILVLLIAIGITGYVVEGLRIIHEQTPHPELSPVGLALASLFQIAGTTTHAAAQMHFFLWWAHAWMALGIIALFPYTRLLHAVAGVVSLAVRTDRPGIMQAVDLETVEQTGRLGVSSLLELTRRQLVQLDACVSCGRCEDACPAFEAGKPLSPRNVVQDLVAVNNSLAPAADAADCLLPGRVIAEEALWSCTTCGACTEVCPLGVNPMGMITDMRRYLVGEGQLRGPPATALQKTGRVRNPLGLSPNDRMQWANGLDVPIVGAADAFEFVYWVGCAAAYDRRIQKIAQSVVKILNSTDVKYAVLGDLESCTGESARRMGDELLFLELASQNIETLNRHGVRKIVAHCPHCVNSFRNDYPQLGASYEVLHHSQVLAKLLAEGTITISDGNRGERPDVITYHDPCYLARANSVMDEPRSVLDAAGQNSSQLVELPRHHRQTACCGGGGGRMWFDDQPHQRLGRDRVEEIRRAQADTVAVSCPFCLTMLRDGLAATDSKTDVRDIAEVLAEAIDHGQPS